MGSGFFSQDNPPPVEQSPAGPGPGNVVVEEPTGVDGATASFYGRGAAPALQAFEEDAKASADEAAASAAAAAQSAVAAAASAGEALNVANGVDEIVDQAEAAKNAAQASATNAGNSATAAATSASAAATSATQASTSANNAGNSATSAATSATNAAASATSAASSASQAASSASSVQAAADTANTKAAEATTSATNAANSATSAANSASTATTKATEAAASASAASGSATSAANSATSAGTSATTATTKASEAATSANNAATSASTATTKASEASTSATNAAASATSAAGSASTATTKASEASTSATNAATSASTATTKASEASTSATNAANSASAASTSATNAANSASAASTSATNAATSATNAANSASAAATSASTASSAQAAAESARDATLAAFDSFDDRYLGTKTSNPTVDNDGNALVAGALYFNSAAGEMRVWTGNAWIAAYVSGAGVLLIANNLSDVANAATARTNLGLGNVENKSSATIRSEITSGNVTTALGYTPYNSSNPAGYISGITSGMVTTALGFTPANKAGDTFTGAVTFSGGINANFAIKAEGGSEGGQFLLEKAPSGSTLSGAHIVVDTVGDVLRIFDGGGLNPGAYLNIKSQANGAGSRILTDTTLTSGNVTTALGFTPYNASNPNGYISGINSSMVTTALGYTPYNSSNPAGYISGINSSMVTTALGYTPVQQGGGTGQDANKVYIGWLGSALGLQVDATNFGSSWPISVTGNAATVTSITGSQVTTALGYTPANKAGDTFTGLVSISGSGATPAVRLVSSVGGRDYRLWQKDDGRLTITDETAPAERLSITSTGNVTANVDLRTPIIYDLNNTGYYIDPTGATSLRTYGDWRADNSPWTGEYNGKIQYHATNWYFQGAGNWEFRRSDSGYAFFVSQSGTAQAPNDFRAPIFYDLNDTGYYVDPNGTSVLNGVNIAAYNPLFSSGAFQYHQHQSPHIAFIKKTGGYNWYWRRNDTGLVGGANEVEDMSLTEGGSLIARTDIRAPMFLDSNDTSFYINPNGETQLNTLKVRGETMVPGSMDGDWDGGYYHFGNTNDTPTGQWGHAEIIRLDPNWNVQTFWPTSNTNEIWTRRRNNGTYSAWRRYLIENEWIGSKYFGSDGTIYGTIFYDSNNGAFYCDPSGTSVLNTVNVSVNNSSFGGGVGLGGAGNGSFIRGTSQDGASSTASNLQLQSWYGIGFGPSISGQTVPIGENAAWIDCRLGDVYARRLLIAGQDVRGPLFYDSQNTAYYVDPNSNSNLLNINANYIRSFGNLDVDNDLIVGTASGKTSSYIYMKDGDHGDRIIHCNSNRIGFLTQGGGWGSFCEDDGSWTSEHSLRAPIFYDHNDTNYYVNPNGTSTLYDLNTYGLHIGRTGLGSNVNTMNDLGSFSVRGDVNNAAVISFHRSNAYAINMGLGTDAVFRIGGWSASNNCLQLTGGGDMTILTSVRTPVFYNSNDTISRWSGNDLVMRGGSPTIFLRDTDHNSAMIHCNSNVFYVLRGGNDTETWSQVNGRWPLEINLTNNNAIFGGILEGATDVRAPLFYDSNNTGFYLDPNSTGTSLNVAGAIVAAGNITAYSDARVKTNVAPIGHALDKVAKIGGYTYTRTDLADSGRVYGGVIAQEIEQVLPEAIFDNGNLKSVDYNATIALLIEAIKELKSEVDNLKATVH